jgi:hypothetical protein
MRSVFDDYLPIEARDSRGGRRMTLTPAEFTSAVREIRAAMKLGKGQGGKGAELAALAEKYDVDLRTLYRWVEDELITVNLNGWTAVFRQRAGEPPRQATGWSK